MSVIREIADIPEDFSVPHLSFPDLYNFSSPISNFFCGRASRNWVKEMLLALLKYF